MALTSVFPFIICVLGAPGSGKGTLCWLLTKDYDFHHLSVGDYMREECQNPESSEGEAIKEYLQRGELVPTKVILPMLRKKIDDERKKGHERFLIDGFPRQIEQGVEFETMIRSPALVISLKCPEDIARQRYLSRNLPGRLLDNQPLFEKRFQEFERENPTIVQHFHAAGNLVEVDSSSETNVSYERLLEALKKNNTWRWITSEAEQRSNP